MAVISRKGGAVGKNPQRRYTFSVVQAEPISPKTPALIKGQAKDTFINTTQDPVISIPAFIDNSVIMMQNRLETVQQALRKNPDAFDKYDHRFEHSLLNSVYKTVQNVAYHVNKLMIKLNPREEKWPRPIDGDDGLDMTSGLRTAMTRCQSGGTKLTQLVTARKKMLNVDTTREVLGDQGMDMLARIATAMELALVKSGRVVDALRLAEERRKLKVMQKAAGAFLLLQADSGDPTKMLEMFFRAWTEITAEEKKERLLAQELQAEEAEEALAAAAAAATAAESGEAATEE